MMVIQRSAASGGSSAAIEGLLDRLTYASLSAFVFTVPWADGLPIIGGFVVGRWVGLLAAAMVVLRSLVGRKCRRLSIAHYWMLAVVGVAVLSILWTEDRESTADRIGTYIQLLIAAWLIWEVARSQTRVWGLLSSYILGASVGAFHTIYNFLAGTSSQDLYAQAGITRWGKNRYAIAGLNENDLALILALSIPMTLYLLAVRRGLPALLLWIHLGASITAILLTASRGGLAAAVIGLAMMAPMTLFRMSWRQRATAVVVAAAILACGLWMVPEPTLRRILRFGSEIAGGTLTHRTVIWAAGLEVLREHPFLGIGSGAYGPAVVQVIDVPFVAHNTFLSVAVETGIIGALLLLGLLGSLLYLAFRMARIEKWLWLALMATWIVGVSSLTWEYHKPTWVLFGLLVAHAYSLYGVGSRSHYFVRTSGRQRMACDVGLVYQRVRKA